MQANCKRVFIVGAGFSFYAGLPLASRFTQALVAAQDPGTGRSGELVDHLSKFVGAAFGHTKTSPDDWPALEDLFTCIDLAANTGHHLGQGYSAARLRTVRRCVIARIVRMLHKRLERAASKKSKHWKLLKDLLTKVDYESSAFVSMNWDEVIERRFRSIHSGEEVDLNYGCDAEPITISTDGRSVQRVLARPKTTLRITKIHGSVNWLYCDNCQQVFWLQYGQGDKISNHLLSAREWTSIATKQRSSNKQERGDKQKTNNRPWTCPSCKRVPLSTRLATFSYRKGLDFPMFQKSWSTAENLLRQAETWAFIGYSLPAADYEFKYLLKRIQLSRRPLPRIVLVTGGRGSATTYKNYERFFGKQLEVGKNCFLRGLNRKSIAALLSY